MRLQPVSGPRQLRCFCEKGRARRAAIGIGLALGLMAAPPTQAQAQELGNPARGRTSAAALCADCHWTEPEAGRSPLSEAPPFAVVAKTKGMTAMALNVWLLSSHPTMPNLILKPDMADDIVAYILTLTTRAPAASPKGD